MEYPIVRTSNWLCLSITCLLPTIRYSASAILLDAAAAWHQRLTRPHRRAVWGKPEETQMVSLNIGVMKVCAPGERPMVNPHALALSPFWQSPLPPASPTWMSGCTRADTKHASVFVSFCQHQSSKASPQAPNAQDCKVYDEWFHVSQRVHYPHLATTISYCRATIS